MTRPGIDVIESALIEMLQDDPTLAAYVPANQIQSHDQGVDFDNAEIIVAPPAVLVAYDGSSYTPANTENSAYSIDERFVLIAVAEDLRSAAAAKAGVFSLIEDLKVSVVTNRRLTLDATTGKRVTLKLLGVAILENYFYRTGCMAYGLRIQVTGTTWDLL
jgi:hypothetical protein